MDRKEDDASRKPLKSVGEIKDKDETRDPPLQICSDIFCGVTTPRQLGGSDEVLEGSVACTISVV